jgi:hypothetical protein
MRFGKRYYGPEEYTRVEGQPMPPGRLAVVLADTWRRLPESERLAFVLALEPEDVADEVIVLTTERKD